MSQEEFRGKTVHFPEDELNKTFDAEGRIIEIEFLKTGKKCKIEYTGDCWGSRDICHITWSDGYKYMTYRKVDEKVEGDIKPVVGSVLLERENPNTERILSMEFDERGKLISVEKHLSGKTIFKRSIGDFGFDGRIRRYETENAQVYL